MKPFDPRLTPARPDLAAKHLEGRVVASRFVEGEVYEVIAPQAPLRRVPQPDAAFETEALKGERATIYEVTEEGWAWGQLEADGYVGWLPSDALRAPGPAPTHKVAALRTLMFPGPSIKLPPVGALTFGSRLAIARTEGPLAVTADGAYVPAQHLAPLETALEDFVAVAETFVGVPYLWGGRTSFGIDCSGLVQTALAACGLACPRDTDMQEPALGERIDPGPRLAGLARGDLIFWPGHVAIVRNRTTMIHANAFHMAVAIEPTKRALARIRKTGSEVSSMKRIA